jgi:hypothetical protein
LVCSRSIRNPSGIMCSISSTNLFPRLNSRRGKYLTICET